MAWRGGAEVGEVALQGLTYAQRLGLLALVQQSRDGAGGHRLPGVDDFHLSWGWAGCAGCQGRPGGCQASQHTTTARAGLWASALTPGTVSAGWAWRDPARGVADRPVGHALLSFSSTSLLEPGTGPILPTGVPRGLTRGGVVDREDDPSTQAHALGVDDPGADQSRDGGVHRRAALLEDGSGGPGAG